MAISFSRRRVPAESSSDEGGEKTPPALHVEQIPTLSHDPQRSYRPAPFIILLLLLVIWSTSTLLSGSVFHVCLSSRKLTVYCISGGLEDSSSYDSSAEALTMAKKKEEKAHAVKVVEEQLRAIRSLATSPSTTKPNSKNCGGRGVYVYDLPTKFNHDLVANCHVMVPWLCSYMANDGMGEPIPGLGDGWYGTHQYSLEVIFHHRVLRHPCRVLDPDDARLFYVPYYGGLDIFRWNLYDNVSSDVRDSLGVELVRWLETQRAWARNGGSDHMFVLGTISWNFRSNGSDSWGSNFLELENVSGSYKLLLERQPWEVNEIGVPYPTYFHPRSDDDVVRWQSKALSSNRTKLASFAGADRPGEVGNLRSILIQQCKSADGEACSFLDCSSDGCLEHEAVVGLFLGSEFCLQPPGDSPSRKSVFDSLVAGCIPVFFDPFTAYYQYPWHLPDDRRKYSVFIDQEEFKDNHEAVDVMGRLRSVPRWEREEMRRYVVYELVPGLVYGDPSSEFRRFSDAFDIVMGNMMEKVTRSVV